MEWKITKALADAIIDTAKYTYPQEFFSLLAEKKRKGVLEEMVVVQATFGDTFALIKDWTIPFNKKIKGSVHSHPSPNFLPSKADILTFARMGKINFIVGYPYNLNTLKAYDVNGKPIEYEVVE